MKLPTVREITRDLANCKAEMMMMNSSLRVRLHVWKTGSWCCYCGPWYFHHGEQPSGKIRRGFSAYATIDRATNCWRLARNLLADVRQQIPVRHYVRRNR